jgi:serine/threonine protein kinase
MEVDESVDARVMNMNEDTIFHIAREKPPEERAVFLETACGGDETLRRRLEVILRAHDQPGSFLARPAIDVGLTLDVPVEPDECGCDPSGALVLDGRRICDHAGARIGPYKLLEQIGEGGMGVVFMAEQEAPVQRKVAVKIIRPGMDNRQVIARFEAERQALALMDHPNIAKVLDAGTTNPSPRSEVTNPKSETRNSNEERAPRAASDSGPRALNFSRGLPYFVMELVKGVPITEYCDRNHLTPRKRLELFVPVCQAVQHAHQKGIIHRDLKPSNVLIALYDGKPVPKVIDFGVAKATGPKLTERTLFTHFGSIVGTFEYMSPEQAELNQLDIDTRSDIYSLGVILYELLTGTTPLERRRVKESALLEVLRWIREEEPARPSTRIGSSAAELPAIAANRGLEPKKLSGIVRGELDWIVMKALEKDRARRYETANSLAMDLRRYLADEPVLACPPSAWYRFAKFTRRNRAAVIAAAVVAFALVSTLGSLAASTFWVSRERDEARRQSKRAEISLQKAHQAVNDYFTLVSESTLLQEPAMEPLREQLLESALRYYQDFAREQGDAPEVRAELVAAYLRIAVLLHDLARGGDWRLPVEKAVELMEDLVREGADSSSFASLRQGVYRLNASSHMHIQDPQKTLECLLRARSLWEGLVRREPSVPGFRNDLGIFLHVVAALQLHEGRMEQSLQTYRRAVDIRGGLVREFPTVPHYRGALAMTLRDQGLALAEAGRVRDAEAVCRESRDHLKKLVADSPGVPVWKDVLTNALGQLGEILEGTGRLPEAEECYREMLTIQESLLAGNPAVARYRYGVLSSLTQLGELLWGSGRLAEAKDQYRRLRRLGAEVGPDERQSRHVLAWLLATGPFHEFRDGAQAVRIARRLMEEEPHNPEHQLTLGAAHVEAGDWVGAVAALKRPQEDFGRSAVVANFLLARALRELGREDEARGCYQRAVSRLEQHPNQTLEIRRIRAEAESVAGIRGK